MAHVVVPYTRIEPDVMDAVPDAEWCYVGHDDAAYWGLLADLWAEGETFIIVEHDIVPTEADLQALAECPEGWCAAGYPFEDLGTYWGLGCTKFEGWFTRRYPEVVDRLTVGGDDVHPLHHWCNLDALLQGALAAHGQAPHHHGLVRHLSTVRGHDACR